MIKDLEFVILGGGKGTRNYPHAKGLPHKCLLPLGSMKIIDVIMSQIIAAGAKHITIIVSDEYAKKAFEDNFMPEPDVEKKFEQTGNIAGLELMRETRIPDDVEIRYVIQPEPKGVGDALARAYSGKSILMIWPDDVVMPSGKSVFQRALDQYNGIGNMVVTRKVEDPSRWGIIEDGFYVEKPKQSKSDQAAIGFCILDKKVCEELLQDAKNFDGVGELTHIPALNRVIENDPEVMALKTIPLTETDTYLNCGDIAGYEKSLLYSLLHESKFAKENLDFAGAFYKC